MLTPGPLAIPDRATIACQWQRTFDTLAWSLQWIPRSCWSVDHIQAGPLSCTGLRRRSLDSQWTRRVLRLECAMWLGLVCSAEQRCESMYEFRCIRPVAGQPFSIEFVGGPAAGVLPAQQPAQYLEPVQRIPTLVDDSVFRGAGEVAGVAVYERRVEEVLTAMSPRRQTGFSERPLLSKRHRQSRTGTAT